MKINTRSRSQEKYGKKKIICWGMDEYKFQ